ncbi:hypothetical protein TH9_12395 [Thalassospira xiamenensis]|nr:hypothetical protein [Thalassospira xiamenensis]RCK32518.1 hypothetical protein TH9_12395 [Thalassospira xiamenensis]
MGDGARADIRGKLLEYPPDNLGLIGIDSAFAPDGLSVCADFMNGIIAIATPTGIASGFGAGGCAAFDLECQVLEEHGRHRALKPDMHFVDFAIRDGQDFDLVIGQLLVNGRNVFLIAGKAV